MHNLEGAWVAFSRHDHAHTAHVVPAADHDHIALLELHMVQHLSIREVEADGVIRLDVRVWVAQGTAIVGDGIRGAPEALHHLFHAAQLVGRLLLHDFVQHKATLGVIEQAEVFLGLFDLHDVHESSGVEHVSADLAVDLDQALHDDHLALPVRQGVLQALPQHHDEWHALTQLVRAAGRPRSPAALQFVQHPVRGRKHALEMLFRSTSHAACVR
mmetsp:Transcript_82085/g.266026  ORF Transcript_82085/g.266026 Transcript_82085/m.266026 type:complete len:215 (-) Transcript_82085:68-712(-)